MKTFSALALGFGFSLTLAFAADLPIQPPPAPVGAPAPAADVPVQGYGQHDLTCQTWTDGCRNCERTADGSSCSNIGIACQPGTIKCTSQKGRAQ